MLDITMTATMRPDILNVTINSFFKYMLSEYVNTGHKIRLIINVDKVGGGSRSEVLGAVDNRFHSSYIYIPTAPSFPQAFKRVWSEVKADYVLHLEDDWELLRYVSLSCLIGLLKLEPDLALLRLPSFRAGSSDMKNWDVFFPYNGRYYECPEECRGGIGFCGHPSIIRGDFIRSIAPLLNDTYNPEKQFHVKNSAVMKEVLKWRYGVYGIPNTSPLILDIGRKWMIKNNYRKQGNKAFFTKWEEVSSG